MTQRDEGHNYRDSKNKAQAYERKQKEKLLKEFEEWLYTCPVDWYEVGHPSSDIVSVNFLPDVFNKHIYQKE